MEPRQISIRGAREHNLKNVSLDIPRDRFVVITGLSGSGKSSLAFDTLYAEGQRRYLESLSAYARQFMEQMRKPEVDLIEGLSPSISIEQKNISRNPRSTVGTVTEIYDYLRLLYARTGSAMCFVCGKPIRSQTVSQIADHVLALPQGTKLAVLAPIVRGKKGEYQKEMSELRRQGFVRARIDGKAVDLSLPITLKKSLKHDISVYIDRLVLKKAVEARLAEALEIAAGLAEGLVEIELLDSGEVRYFSTRFACADCGTSFPEMEPRSFSFNSPHGACPRCDGMGVEYVFDPARIVPDDSLSLSRGAILPWRKKSAAWIDRVLAPVAARFRFSLDQPYRELSAKAKEILLRGSSEAVEFEAKGSAASHKFLQKFQGVIPWLQDQLELAETDEEKAEVESFRVPVTCQECAGKRLRKESLSVLLGGKNIADLCDLNVTRALMFLANLKWTKSQSAIAEPLLKEITSRLAFLTNVGLSYLTLSRTAATLSGGEAQRIRLATQIGSGLVGVVYILDEPSIGLHQRDNESLIKTLLALRDQGNSVIVVEHDEDTIRRADFIVDLGPGAGSHGGKVTFLGPPDKLARTSESLTGQYLTGKREIPVPAQRRPTDGQRQLEIRGASRNNLKGVNVRFPLGTFIAVSGVSGSGKSSLVIDTLLPALRHHFDRSQEPATGFDEIRGLEHLDKVIHVDQSPIGRTPRSNPATYTGLFSDIRNLFAGLPESKVRGYGAGRFSFNVQGGRCEACRGDGNIRITMHFLPDVFVACEVCRGSRYNRETLQVHYRGKHISDVLNMTVEEALSFFERVPSIRSRLQTLADVGLGYVHVGQSAVTLSGGEAQRIKLAKELSRRATGRTLYILDEPTTGLHFEDIRNLMRILHFLVDQGNTVVVIEHHLDVIKQADWVIDLGPEGGDAGGLVVFQGSPEGLSRQPGSYTGQYLAKILTAARATRPPSEKTVSS